MTGEGKREGASRGDKGEKEARVHQPKERLSCRLRAIPC